MLLTWYPILLFLQITKGEIRWSTNNRKYTKKPASSWGDEGRKRFKSLVEQEKEHRNNYDRLVGNDSSDDDEEDNDINNEREDCFDYQPSDTDSISEGESEDGTQNQTRWATPIEV